MEDRRGVYQHDAGNSEADGKKIRRAEERAEKALKSTASKESEMVTALRVVSLLECPQIQRSGSKGNLSGKR